MSIILQRLRSALARYLSQPRAHYDRFSLFSQVQLMTYLFLATTFELEGAVVDPSGVAG